MSLTIPLEIQLSVIDTVLRDVLDTLRRFPVFLPCHNPRRNLPNHNYPLPVADLLSLLVVSRQISSHVLLSPIFKHIRLRVEYLEPRALRLVGPGRGIITLRMRSELEVVYASRYLDPGKEPIDRPLPVIASEKFYLVPRINDSMDIEYFTIQSFQCGTYLRVDPRTANPLFECYAACQDPGIDDFEKFKIDFIDDSQVVIKTAVDPFSFLTMTGHGVQRYDEDSLRRATSEGFKSDLVRFKIFPPLPPDPEDVFLHPKLYVRPKQGGSSLDVPSAPKSKNLAASSNKLHIDTCKMCIIS